MSILCPRLRGAAPTLASTIALELLYPRLDNLFAGCTLPDNTYVRTLLDKYLRGN